MISPTPKVNASLRVALGAAVIALATIWVFLPSIHGGWVWDDLAEIGRNPVLRDPDGIRKIWFAPVGADYFPLKTTAQWVEWHLWSDNPLGYHWVNVGLHLESCFLIWRLLAKLGARHAWVGGLLFAVHPLVVESVAWISEFKNTLSLPLLLLAMLAWISGDSEKGGAAGPPDAKGADSSYGPDGAAGTRRPTSGEFRFRSHPSSFCNKKRLLSLALFVLAMLSKTSVVMFPAVILLYCWWKRGRVTRSDLIASVPFFAVSVVLGLVTVFFQEQRAIAGADLSTGGLLPRSAGAGLAVLFYFWKSVFPVGLIPNYPLWHLNPPKPAFFLPWLLIAGIFIALIGRCKRVWNTNSEAGRRGDASPHLLFGLGFFFINLLPVIGFIPMSYLRISWVADHFAYLPLVGIVGLAAAAVGMVGGKKAVWVWTAAFIATAALAIESHRYAAVFASDESVWNYTLEHNPNSWTAHNDLGMDLAQGGRLSEAIEQYEAALRLKPDYASAEVNFGNALVRSNRLPEALDQYRAALRLEPRNVEAGTDLGNALAQSGQYAAAVDCYEQVIRSNPGFAEARSDLAYAHYEWGNSLGNAGRFSEAIDQYTEALRLKPDYAEADANLGLALANAGRPEEAFPHLEEALRLKPRYEQAEAYFGFALAAAGRLPEAIAHYKKALELNPGDADVHYNLGLALQQAGRFEEADVQFSEARKGK